MKNIARLGLVVSILGNAAVAAPPTGRYKQIVDALNALQAMHPTTSHVYSIGTNDDGVEIYAIRISTSPQAIDPSKIGHVMVSTHHGNELKAPVFTMRFIKDLLERYDSPELWKGRLGDTEWTVVPVLNISGYNANQREEHGRDPNRDYPNPCLSAPGGKLKSIRAAIALLQTRIFVGNVTVHGYDGSLTYPWGMFADNTHTLDHNYYHSLFSKAAALNGYRVGTAADVVYPANGCYEDYIYWKHGHWSLLLELRDGSESDITKTVKATASFYDQLDASPSTKNQFTGNCSREYPDLRIE